MGGRGSTVAPTESMCRVSETFCQHSLLAETIKNIKIVYVKLTHQEEPAPLMASKIGKPQMNEESVALQRMG